MSRSHPDNIVQKRQRRARLLHSVYTWHRWLGLSVLLWALVWSVTGLLIEASPTLQLDKKTISSDWLMKRYGIKAPQALQQWQTQGHVITEWDQGVTLNEQWLPMGEAPRLVGVASYAGMLLLATDNHIELFTPNGDYIDRATPPTQPIQQLAVSAEQVIVQTSAQYLSTDADLMQWSPTRADDSIQWSQPSPAAATDIPKAQHDISYERVILDIHSGTLFGPIGRWLSRLAAVVMILLGLTGFYTWFTRFARR